MSDDTRAGFEIRGRFFPMPDAFRVGDPVLIEQLTNLKFEEFAERLDAMGEALRSGATDEVDPVLLPGLLGVAVWQTMKSWTRDKVAKYVTGVGIDEITMHGGDADEEGDQASPPEEGSSTSSPTSTKPAEASD